MKKLILLFLATTLVFTSCNKDDDSPSQDPFIGTWTSYKSFLNGEELELDDCDLQDSLVVNADGTILQSYYYENEGTCELDGEDSATWENLGNSVYRITYSVDEVYEDKITFEGNTFYVETSQTFNGETYTYKEVYIRN